MSIAIQEAITGREDLRKLRDPAQALAPFYRALNGRDLAIMAENRDNLADCAMGNPLGGCHRDVS